MAFQPIVETRTSRNIGYEALLRGPKGTPLARPGLLFGKPETLSGEVLRQLDLACVESALRSGRPLPKDTKLFINVHGGTTYMDGQELFSLMDTLEVDPTRVVLEVSETIDAAHVKAIGKFLVPFRKRGVQVALDDVGVRYAWLHHLLYLEPEYFKIDRAFVKNVHRIAAQSPDPPRPSRSRGSRRGHPDRGRHRDRGGRPGPGGARDRLRAGILAGNAEAGRGLAGGFGAGEPLAQRCGRGTHPALIGSGK